MDSTDMSGSSPTSSPLPESPAIEGALELMVGVAVWIERWRPVCQQFVAEVLVPLAREVEPFLQRLEVMVDDYVRESTPALLWLGEQFEVVAAAAVRLAPVLHQLQPWMDLAQKSEAHFMCHAFAFSHWREDLQALEDFAVDVLHLPRSRDAAFFTMLALVEVPWRNAADPVVLLRKKVRESIWRARKTPTADPRSSLFEEGRLRRESLETLSQTALEVADPGALLPLDALEFRSELSQAELTFEAKQLLLLRYEGRVGKLEAARLLGWSLTKVERHWKELQRARPLLRRRFLV